MLGSIMFGINGHISTNTTWNTDVIVTGDLWVDANVTLTINAGVTVWFPKIDQNMDTIGDIDFIVNGRLICAGTETSKVIFTSLEENPDNKDWAGITFAAGASQNQSSLTNVEIYYAYRGILIDGVGIQASNLKLFYSEDYGVRVQNTSSMTRFTNSYIEEVSSDGMLIDSGSVTLTDTSISNNGGYGLKALSSVILSATGLNIVSNGSYGLWLENTQTASFTNSRFNSNTNHGIYIDRMSPSFTNCQVNNNQECGIYIMGNTGTPEFSNCTISNNKFGISLISRPANLSYCNIENNVNGGIGVYRANPTINNCNITKNGLSPVVQTIDFPNQTDWRTTGGAVSFPLALYNSCNPGSGPMLINSITYKKDGDEFYNSYSSTYRYYRNYTRITCNATTYLTDQYSFSMPGRTYHDMPQITITGAINQTISNRTELSLDLYNGDDCPNPRAWVSSLDYTIGYTVGINNLAGTIANLQSNWWGQVTGIDSLVWQVVAGTANYEGAMVSRISNAGCTLVNLPPTITVTAPASLQINPSSTNIQWIGRDYDDVARISLYYNTVNDINGTLIVDNLNEDHVDNYIWDFANTPYGKYYIYARIEDGTNPPAYSFAPGQVMVGPLTVKTENSYAAAGDTIIVPIKALNAYQNFDLSAFQVTLGYTHTLLTYLGIETSGTLVEDWTVNSNGSVIGQISINGFSADVLDGSGDLVRLRFRVNSTATDLQYSDLTISNFQYNNGTLEPVIISERFVVRNRYNLDGNAYYYSNNNPVHSVEVNATGFASGTTVSDASGYFSFPDYYYGEYELTPDYIGSIPELLVSPYDAAIIARYAIGLENLNADQLSAGNVDGDGDVDIYDAALIARYCVGLLPSFPAGDMKFTPLSHTVLLAPSYIARTFNAIAVGDVSGNWGVGRPEPFTPYATFSQEEDAEYLYLKVHYPQQFYSLYSKLNYDRDLLQYISSTPGTGAENLNITINDAIGTLALAAFGVELCTALSDVVTFQFRKLGAIDADAATFENIIFDENLGTVSVDDELMSPAVTTMLQNYPNPFNPTTNLSFTLSNAQHVKIEIYNLKGQKVQTLVNETVPAGKHSLAWDAARYGSGVYFARISTSEGYKKTVKMMLMK